MTEEKLHIRKISFSTQLIKLAEHRAKKMGLNFQEYIKHLVAKDSEKIIYLFDNIKIDQVQEIEDGINETKYGKFLSRMHISELEKMLERWKKDIEKLSPPKPQKVYLPIDME